MKPTPAANFGVEVLWMVMVPVPYIILSGLRLRAICISLMQQWKIIIKTKAKAVSQVCGYKIDLVWCFCV
jgi:hypothetical protein